MKLIASRDNPHFKALRKLCQSGRERRKTGQVVLDGMHLIEAFAASSGVSGETMVSESGARRPEIAAYLARQAEPCRISVLSDALFAELAVVDTPSGIMAIVAQPAAKGLPDPAADALLLDGVQDPGNVGSILRSAAAAGCRQILLSGDCAQVWSPKTLRAAMGAHFQLALFEGCDLVSFLEAYRGQSVVTTPTAASSLYGADLSSPLAWVFGSEGQGVSPAVAGAAAAKVGIPMAANTESLNVAAAAAVCLFETMRQRLTKNG